MTVSKAVELLVKFQDMNPNILVETNKDTVRHNPTLYIPTKLLLFSRFELMLKVSLCPK